MGSEWCIVDLESYVKVAQYFIVMVQMMQSAVVPFKDFLSEPSRITKHEKPHGNLRVCLEIFSSINIQDTPGFTHGRDL